MRTGVTLASNHQHTMLNFLLFKFHYGASRNVSDLSKSEAIGYKSQSAKALASAEERPPVPNRYDSGGGVTLTSKHQN